MPILVGDLSGVSKGISDFGEGIASGLERRAKNRLLKEDQQDQRTANQVSTDWISNYDSNLSAGENISILQQTLDAQGVSQKAQQPILQKIISRAAGQAPELAEYEQYFGQKQPASRDLEPSQQEQIPDQPVAARPPQDRMARFSNEDLVTMAANPNKMVNQTAKAEIEKRKIDQRVNEADRKYHTQFAAKQEEKIAGLREAVPKKKSALRHARNSVESGQVGAFSINQIADSIGGALGDTLRTAKGAQLVTAGKENLLSNMARVSAKAQNQWFEQRLASMFPRVGQTMEANLAIQEMLESELVMEEAYLKKFDEFAAADESLYGYAKKDVDRRARQAVEHLEDLSFNRSSYRLRQLEESEMGRKGMQKSLMKKVPNGTPMTLEMGAMFIDRFKDPKKALENAKKLGYSVPNGEDLQLYLMSNEEFAERLGSM